MITEGGEIVSEVRVLIYGVPALHSDVIARIVSAQTDLTVVGRGTDAATLSAAIERTKPHVVLVSAAGGEQQNSMLTILAHFPEIGVLLVGADAAGLVAHTIVRVPAEGEWHTTLVKVIRTSARAKRCRKRQDQKR